MTSAPPARSAWPPSAGVGGDAVRERIDWLALAFSTALVFVGGLGLGMMIASWP